MRYFGKVVFLACSLFCINICNAKNIIPEITDAFKHGSPELDFRFRQEDSKQQGLLTGYANTLRTKVGYETSDFFQWAFKVELVDVSHFFGLHYNPGVSDLYLPQYTLIPDPPGAGISEIKFTYKGFDRNLIILGRQYINLDNQRFIGANEFRQYPQSFDSLTWDCTKLNNFDLFYAYIFDVETNFANGRAAEGQRRLSTNVLNLEYTGSKYGIFGGYLYLNNDHSVNTNSNLTLGFRLQSPTDLVATNYYAYLFEAAWQHGQFNNPVKYNAAYMHFTFSKTKSYYTGLIGFESLSGNGNAANKAFITPLGSVDNFSGMAQAFTTTPNRGLQDLYFTASACRNQFSAGATYHLFWLQKNSHKFAGQEIDLYADLQINKQLNFSIVYAAYAAKNKAALSAHRFWFMLYAHLL